MSDLTQMQDKLGMPINIGDLVVYNKTEQNNTNMYTGLVTNIFERTNWRGPHLVAKIKAHDTNRLIDRVTNELICVEFAKQVYPELFI